MLAVQWNYVLEAGMLICFGVSWPVAILKTVRTGRVSGKSLGFLVLVFVGYLCGIAAKLTYAWSQGRPVPWVTALYAVNAGMVAVDAILYVLFSRQERAATASVA